jgi:hypothetical protein
MRAPVGHGARPSSPANGEQPGYIEDSAKAVPSGVLKGLTTIAGLPHLWEDLGDWMLGQMGRIPGMTPKDIQGMRDAIALGRQYSNFRNVETPTSAEWRDIAEHFTGPLYEPRTRPGKVVGNIAEFAPAAVLGPGSLGRNLFNFAVIPGATSEIAGQITEGTLYETPVRWGLRVSLGCWRRSSIVRRGHRAHLRQRRHANNE